MEKTIGQSKVTEVLPHLEAIARQYNLKLNRLHDFKLARLLLAVLYSNHENISESLDIYLGET